MPCLAWISISFYLGIAALTLLPLVRPEEVPELFDVLVYAANAAGVRHLQTSKSEK